MSKAQTVADAFYEEECRGAGGDSATTFDAAAILDRAVAATVTVDVVSVNGEALTLASNLVFLQHSTPARDVSSNLLSHE